MVMSQTRNSVSPGAWHRFILSDYVCEYSVFDVLRQECPCARVLVKFVVTNGLDDMAKIRTFLVSVVGRPAGLCRTI
jgi:hypothetical protein